MSISRGWVAHTLKAWVIGAIRSWNRSYKREEEAELMTVITVSKR